jgi:hypothetical protein
MRVKYGEGFQVANTAADTPLADPGLSFREAILSVQSGMEKLIEEGVVQSTLEDCTLRHFFTPRDDKYGCCTYAREMLIPKDTLIVGKIHRHQHLNFITKGSARVYTEFGDFVVTAPHTFISEVGLKRAVYALEDVLWTTVHLTEHIGEDKLHDVEREVIAPTYEALGLSYGTNNELTSIGEGI